MQECHTTSGSTDVQISSFVAHPGGGDGKGNVLIPFIAEFRGRRVTVLLDTARRNCGCGYVKVIHHKRDVTTVPITDLRAIDRGPTAYEMSRLFRQGLQAKKTGSDISDFRAFSEKMSQEVTVKPITITQVDGTIACRVDVIYETPETIEVAWTDLEAAPGGPSKGAIINVLRSKLDKSRRPGEDLRSPDHRTPFRGAENATKPVM